MTIQHLTFPNNLRVVLEPIPHVRSVSFGVWVRNGSRNEDPATNGISHFIEHMLFKGTENRSARQIADDMDAVGGQINAYTAKEYTCYYTLTLDTHFDTALDVLGDMFFNSRFAPDDIEKERNVILEEINMYEDTPDELVHDLLQLVVWKDDPLGRSILGAPGTISNFGHKSFRDYLGGHYVPENTVLALAGNFDPEEAVRKLESRFAGFAGAGKAPEPPGAAVYNPGIIAREKDIEQVHVCLGFPGVSIRSERAYDMSVLNAVFGGGMSSRLFQSIREERGLAYSIYSYNSGYSDAGLYSVYAACAKNQVKDLLALIFQEIGGLFTDRITETQLAKTKEQLKSNYILSLENTSGRMNAIGKATLMLERVLSADELLAKIDAVSLERLYALAGDVFKTERASLSAVGDVEGLDFEGMVDNVRE